MMMVLKYEFAEENPKKSLCPDLFRIEVAVVQPNDIQG
jgi:hypothetical protein